MAHPDTTPYWHDSEHLPSFGSLDRNLTVDVVIVGAGITGITAAYLMKSAGLTVALLERDRAARVDTGHTTAHLTYVTDRRLSELVRDFGAEPARAVWHAGQTALDQIASTVEAEDIECELRRLPAYLHQPLADDDANRSEVRAELKDEAKQAREFGFQASFVERAPLVERPGIRFDSQGTFHPVKYLAGLLPIVNGDGSYVFEKTPVDEVAQDPPDVRAGGHTIKCGYVVIATHSPIVGKASLVDATWLQTKLALYTTYAIGGKVPSGTIPQALFWDTGDPYRYLRVDPHKSFDYVILGGEDHKTGQAPSTSARFAALEDGLRDLAAGVRITHRWSAQVIETNDGLPYIGEIAPRQFAATGFSGNGMTFGTLAGMMARDAVLGRPNPWRDLFDIHRTHVRGGTWDYLKENTDYLYYLVRDRFAAAEGRSLRVLKRNQGKILDLRGTRHAAYRDGRGVVTLCSPYCTHMGCEVGWNDAERTWDCPCHGSRFKPTGEVIAGPAESPLAESSADASDARKAGQVR